MSIKSYLSPLLKYWWLIAAAALVAAVSSFLVTSMQPAIYRTRATLVVGRALFEANPSSNDLYLGQQLASYYADYGQRKDVQEATMRSLGLNALPEYSIQTVPNSQFLEIIVIDTYPPRAQAVANELANQLIVKSPTSNEQQGSERQSFINAQVTYLEERITETLDDISAAEKKLSELSGAREIANAQEEIAALQNKLSNLQTNYAALIANTDQGAANTLSLIESASLPVVPIGPRRGLITLLSTLVAAAIATLAVYLLEFLDDTFKTSEEIAYTTGLQVLANIPVMHTADDLNPEREPKGRLAVGLSRLGVTLPENLHQKKIAGELDHSVFLYSLDHPKSIVADQFRTLRIGLEFASVDKILKTILISSPDASDGKTSVATNLAIVIAQGGKRVVLIDTDFRRPSVARHFQLPNEVGLSDIYLDHVPLTAAMQKTRQSDLTVITTGAPPPNPVDVLSSSKIMQILNEVGENADYVIIDGPPLIVPDSIALASRVDGVLLVVRNSVTRKSFTQARLQLLKNVKASLLGAVLNDSPVSQISHYGSYRHYYTTSTTKGGGNGASPKAEAVRNKKALP